MQILKLISIGACVALLSTGCYFGDDDIFGCIRGNGDIHSEEFFLPEITGVKLSGVGDVIIRHGDAQEIIVETDQNLMTYVDRDVHNGLWTIDFDRCVKRLTRLTVYITVPNIKKVVISGSGSIRGLDVFNGPELDATLSGSGSIEFRYNADKIDAHISGSGNIDLYGTADFFNVNVSGSGDVRAFDMISQECDVFIAGSGDVRVTVEDFLKVRINGSGDVLYKGNPTIDVDISGSGSVINRN
jgi:hypothetical protein